VQKPSSRHEVVFDAALLAMGERSISRLAVRFVNSPVIFRLVAGNLHEHQQSPLFRMNS
jgi:hypothetical protein